MGDLLCVCGNSRAGKNELAQLAAMVNLKTDGVPKLGRQLPLVDQSGCLTLQQALARYSKGSNWHFGYMVHVGVDKVTGIVHSVEVTIANVHDVEVTPKLLTSEDDTVIGDSVNI